MAVASIWAVLVPTAYILSARMGIIGIWLGYPAQFSVWLIMQYGYYYFFWRDRQHQKLLSTA
jgi:Na+-driven multidrug efflux pump